MRRWRKYSPTRERCCFGHFTAALLGLVQRSIGPSGYFPESGDSPTVFRELQQPNTPPAVREWAAALPPWVTVQTPKSIDLVLDVDAGELEAICLAQEIKAAAVLMDDRAGRNAMRTRGDRNNWVAGAGRNPRVTGSVASDGTASANQRAAEFRLGQCRPCTGQSTKASATRHERLVAEATVLCSPQL